MGLDTKYRPTRYSDVLGQESTIAILRQFILKRKAWEQGYLFAGPFGSGKTTLARIMARAMLCDTPTPEGDPCDACDSCVSILKTGASLDFIEVDAATNSGKDSIQKIVEEIQYDSFSGRRRLYLFDESHRLSTQALDALLKPMEEGKLIVLFATTAPEDMAETVFSRCAPAFVVQPVPPEDIAKRLALICEKEGIPADFEMLVTIAEMKECHIRDCLKAIEGVSMLGAVNRDNVVSYLHLDQNNGYLDVLENLGLDFGKTIESVRKVLKKTSPSICYAKLADLTMLAYQAALGYTKPPAYMDSERVVALGKQHGSALLGYASRFSSRPGYPSEAMLICDLGVLHHTGGRVASDAVVIMPSPQQSTGRPLPPTPAVVSQIAAPTPLVSNPSSGGSVPRQGPSNVEVKPLPGAVNDGRPRGAGVTRTISPSVAGELGVADFARLLGVAVRDAKRTSGGSS